VTRPPRRAVQILERRLHPDERDELLGDLEEQFRRRERDRSAAAARWWYWRQALALLWGFGVSRRDLVSTSHERTRGRWAAGNLRADVRYAFRSLHRAPSFALVALLTLTSGIGLSTAVFSLVGAILVTPLPYAHPDRIVRLAEARPGEPLPPAGGQLTDTAVGLWLSHHEALDALAPYSSDGVTVALPSGPANVVVADVGAAFFQILERPPLAGRLLRPADAAASAPPVAVISDRLWQSAFARRADAVGSTVVIDNRAREVVGVAARTFAMPSPDVDIWIPGTWTWPAPGVQRSFQLRIQAVGRLRPGTSVDEADREGATIAATIATAAASAGSAAPAVSHIRARLLLDDVVAPVKPALVTLAGGMLLVLLAACVSLANLLLARHTARQRELAVRLALGASRWRIARPVLIEQILLTGGGGLCGGALAWWLVGAVPALAPGSLPRVGDVHFDLASLGFATLASLLTAVVAGVLPVLPMPARELRELSASDRVWVGRTARSADRLRGLLVVGQVALAVVLLVGALLVGRSLAALLRVNPGYRPEGVLTFQVGFPGSAPRQTGRMAAFYAGMLARIRRHPSVVSAGYAMALPLHEIGLRSSIRVVGRALPPPTSPRDMAISQAIDGDYLQTVGTRVLQGRSFTPADTAGAERVVLIDEDLARRIFPDGDAIGHQVIGPRAAPFTIVGVVEPVHASGLADAADPVIYYYAPQLASMGEILAYFPTGSGIAVRTNGDPMDLVPFLRDQARELDPTLPLYHVARLSDELSGTIAQPRFFAWVLGLFATLALSTALLGIYGVLAYAVERRRVEFGVRRALGATERHVTMLVVRRGLGLAAAGVTLGLAGAALTTGLLRAQLFGVGPADPVSFVSACALVVLAVVAASWQPVRRALRIDPARALRVG
jgi:putative ABC transport system permease protein